MWHRVSARDFGFALTRPGGGYQPTNRRHLVFLARHVAMAKRWLNWPGHRSGWLSRSLDDSAFLHSPTCNATGRSALVSKDFDCHPLYPESLRSLSRKSLCVDEDAFLRSSNRACWALKCGGSLPEMRSWDSPALLVDSRARSDDSDFYI